MKCAGIFMIGAWLPEILRPSTESIGGLVISANNAVWRNLGCCKVGLVTISGSAF